MLIAGTSSFGLNIAAVMPMYVQTIEISVHISLLSGLHRFNSSLESLSKASTAPLQRVRNAAILFVLNSANSRYIIFIMSVILLSDSQYVKHATHAAEHISWCVL